MIALNQNFASFPSCPTRCDTTAVDGVAQSFTLCTPKAFGAGRRVSLGSLPNARRARQSLASYATNRQQTKSLRYSRAGALRYELRLDTLLNRGTCADL